MQAHLDKMDVRGLELSIGPVHATLGGMTGLTGDVTQAAERTTIDRAAATRAEVATLKVDLGTTVIASQDSVVFDELRGTFARDPGGVRCEVQAAQADGLKMRLAIKELVISGRLVMSNARLRINGGEGSLFADGVAISDLSVERAGSQVSVERLEGTTVAIEWGGPGLRVRAVSLQLGATTFAVTFGPRAAAAAPATPPSSNAGPLPDWLTAILPLFDGLAGQLDVNLGLDIAVPVIGHRRATHEFRLPIENGSLDYRQLESGLSRLEDSLLDFSLREEGLVLEVGIPMLPTRGMGKPIVRWDVTGDDLVRAQQNRIRVAKLLQFRMAGDAASADANTDAPAPDTGPGRLRELSLRPLVANLRIEHAAPPAALPLQRVGELAVRADLHHSVETQPRDGTLTARVTDVVLGALQVARPDSRGIRVSNATLESLEMAGEFAGFQPRTVRGAVRGLQLIELDVSPS